MDQYHFKKPVFGANLSCAKPNTKREKKPVEGWWMGELECELAGVGVCLVVAGGHRAAELCWNCAQSTMMAEP